MTIKISRRQILAAGGASLGALAMPAVLRAQTPVTLRVSSSMPQDDNAAHYVWHLRFAQNLTAAVGNAIKLTYFPNSQLGKEADVVQQVKSGSVDMMITGSSIWATAAAEIGMLDLGFLFNDYAHGARALDAGVGDGLAKILFDRTGVTTLGWAFHFGARSVYTRAPVHKVADLKAVKLRVLPAPAFIETFKMIGASPVPIPFNELYTALQTGIVDGFEHDAASVIANKLFEVTKFCFETNHLYSPMLIGLGKRGLDKIPADLRPKFLAAAQEATLYERGQAARNGAAAVEDLKKQGITFTPMPAAERAALVEQMSGKLYAEFAEKYPVTKPLFDIIARARG